MERCLLLLLACVCSQAAPLPDGVEAGNCQDPFAVSAAGLALTRINQDRQEGFVFGLHRLSNVNLMMHGETGIVYYLTLDVLETNCHVLSKKDWKTCAVRETHDIPVYGQCKAVIYINKPHRVVRLYNYDCVVRPVSSTKVGGICPDCPFAIDKENEEIVKTAALSMEKYNKDNGLANHFALLNITRASSSMGMATFYFAEFTIQETSCAKSTDPAQTAKCPLMTCEFAHKGHCKASHSHHPSAADDAITVDCEIYEPESAEREKKLHLLGGETDHSHTDTHAHDPKHDAPHPAGDNHEHDHTHDHTSVHAAGAADAHPEGSEHHHTHDHTEPGGHAHDHAHAHSHDHGHDHDHEHTHHAKAHDHSADAGPNAHHKYEHADGAHTHEHDHEIALDHDHKHAHLHDHEHHHHHHDHTHETTSHRHPEGSVRVLPALDRPTTLPSFPDTPVGPGAGVTLPLVQDPEIPGFREPTILPFPATASKQCPATFKEGEGNAFAKELFAEDPLFKAAA